MEQSGDDSPARPSDDERIGSNNQAEASPISKPERLSGFRQRDIETMGLRRLRFDDIAPSAEATPASAGGLRREDVSAAKDRYPLTGAEFVGDAPSRDDPPRDEETSEDGHAG